MAQHLILEVFLDPGLVACGDLVFIDEKDIVASQREHQLAIGGVKCLAEQFDLILNGMEQIFGIGIAAMLLVDQYAAFTSATRTLKNSSWLLEKIPRKRLAR